MYCSGTQNAILTGMSFDVSNPNIGEFVKKNVKRQQEYEKLILFQCKDGN